jgi:hypothetical protein
MLIGTALSTHHIDRIVCNTLSIGLSSDNESRIQITEYRTQNAEWRRRVDWMVVPDSRMQVAE